MKLWTWQKSTFDITDPSVPVDSQKHSIYEHKDKYQKLYEIFGTAQILWFYSSHDDATSNASSLEYKGKALWEIEVPETHYGNIYGFCGFAWHWIISDASACPPDQFESLYDKLWSAMLKQNIIYQRDDFSKNFNLPWKSKNKEDLWGVLSVDLSVCKDGCPTVILKHPINKNWVNKIQSHEEIFRR